MATGKRHLPDSPGGRRRRPPTLELRATEVTGQPAAESPDATVAAPGGTDPVEPPASKPDAPQSETPSDPPRASSAPGVGRAGIAWLPPGVPWRLIGAGATGAAAVLLLVILAWAFGLGTRRDDATATLAPRLAAIETQLRELAARPPPAAVDTRLLDELQARLSRIDVKAIDELRGRLSRLDPKALDDLAARLAAAESALTARLSRLEAAVAAPRPPVTDTATLNRVTATDDAVKALTAQVAQLTRRLDDLAASLGELQNAARAAVADREAVAALANRLAALEQSNQAIRDELAKRIVASATDRASRLAMLAAALRSAVERGDPFAAELAAVRPLAADDKALAPLEAFAANGLPSAAALGRALGELIEPIRRAALPAAQDAGFIDRLQANARKLVRVHPVGDVPGDEPSAILARIESKAGHADIGGALAELAKLPAAMRAPAEDWIAKAKARQDAVAAVNRLTAAALSALKTTP